MKARILVVLGLVCLAAAAARLDSQMPAGQMVEMTGMKPTLKLQTPLEGFFTLATISP